MLICQYLPSKSTVIFPHIFVWGSCFWLCTSTWPRLAPPAAYSHTQLAPTQLVTTQLAHTHTHTQLAVDAAALCVAGVALGDIDPHFAWQAWHLVTWTCTLRGRRGTYGTGLALVARLVPRRGRRDTPSFTHNFVTHHVSHTTLSHTILYHTSFHTQLCHTPCFTHNFVTHTHTIFLCHTPSLTHHLSHTTLSHSIFHHTTFHTHTQLCHTPSCTTPAFTHNFVTHHVSHITLSHTRTPSFFVTHHLSHTTLSHSIFHHTTFHTHNFVTHHLVPHQLSHTALSHTPCFTHNFVTHTHTIFLCHTPSFTYDFVPHNCFYFSILHHQLCRSILPRPATTFVAPNWKKLTCGVIRSFNFHHSLPALQVLCSIGWRRSNIERQRQDGGDCESWGKQPGCIEDNETHLLNYVLLFCFPHNISAWTISQISQDESSHEHIWGSKKQVADFKRLMVFFFCPWVSFVPRLVWLCLIGFVVGFSRSPDLGLNDKLSILKCNMTQSHKRCKMHSKCTQNASNEKNRHINMFFLGRYFKIATQLLFHFGWPGHTRPILARNRMVRYFGCGANRVKLEPPVRKSPIQNCVAWTIIVRGTCAPMGKKYGKIMYDTVQAIMV